MRALAQVPRGHAQDTRSRLVAVVLMLLGTGLLSAQLYGCSSSRRVTGSPVVSRGFLAWLRFVQKTRHMDRIWQWMWDRHGSRYSWAVFVVSYGTTLPIWVVSAVVLVELEKSDRYLAASALAALGGAAAMAAGVLPGAGRWEPLERWGAGESVDRRDALEVSYAFARTSVLRTAVAFAIVGGAMGVAGGAVAGASTSRLIQYGIIGATQFTAVQLIAVHMFVEAAVRPCRIAIAGDTGIGDEMPRARPSFAMWSILSILAVAWVFALAGAFFAIAIDRSEEAPVSAVLIAGGLTLFFAVPITVGSAFAPSFRPIRDLTDGTLRVAAGDYSQRLPVAQDDDLGALVGSFNQMQAGLAERERLQAAFGSYVDPTLAARLLEQGDDIFTGERREVTVMFVDIRDFTPYAEANTAEDTVSRLNALFEIVVPAVLDAGGHVNKYLGDGAMAVFGAPNDLSLHADAAVTAASQIHQLVKERFEGELRIGIGINTGQVIAGTIGGAGKLEFTLIGDTVNVAARIEQLTKTTGDSILLTQPTFDALTVRFAGLTDRGAHDLKGKAAATRVYALGVAPTPAP